MGSTSQHKPMGRRVSTKHTCLPRQLEHQYQQLAQELHVPPSNTQGQEARLPRKHGDFWYKCNVAWILSRLLPNFHPRKLYPDRSKEFVPQFTTFLHLTNSKQTAAATSALSSLTLKPAHPPPSNFPTISSPGSSLKPYSLSPPPPSCFLPSPTPCWCGVASISTPSSQPVSRPPSSLRQPRAS